MSWMKEPKYRSAWRRQRGKCFYCDVPMILPGKDGRNGTHPQCCTRDHVLPKSLGGTLAKGNVVLACRTCNNKKGDAPIGEAYERLLGQ